MTPPRSRLAMTVHGGLLLLCAGVLGVQLWTGAVNWSVAFSAGPGGVMLGLLVADYALSLATSARADANYWRDLATSARADELQP